MMHNLSNIRKVCESSNKKKIAPVLISDIAHVYPHDLVTDNDISIVRIKNTCMIWFTIDNNKNFTKLDENNFNSFPYQKFE